MPTAPNVYTENEQVAKYEIMDGAPVRGGCGYYGCGQLLLMNR